MKKEIVIKGFTTALPLVVILEMFLYLSNKSRVPEGILVFIKPLLYFLFAICAVGIPIYYYFTTLENNLRKMISIIGVSWAIFLFFNYLDVFLLRGGPHDMFFTSPKDIFNFALIVFGMYLGGFISLAILSSAIAVLGKRFIFKKKAV